MPANGNSCHSNTAMVQQATLDVLKDIRKRKADKKVRVDDGFKHLQADYFIISISPTDGGGFCRCAECLKIGIHFGSPANLCQHDCPAPCARSSPTIGSVTMERIRKPRCRRPSRPQPGVLVFLTQLHPQLLL